jgi:hypothetical protein
MKTNVLFAFHVTMLILIGSFLLLPWKIFTLVTVGTAWLLIVGGFLGLVKAIYDIDNGVESILAVIAEDLYDPPMWALICTLVSLIILFFTGRWFMLLAWVGLLAFYWLSYRNKVLEHQSA